MIIVINIIGTLFLLTILAGAIMILWKIWKAC